MASSPQKPRARRPWWHYYRNRSSVKAAASIYHLRRTQLQFNYTVSAILKNYGAHRATSGNLVSNRATPILSAVQRKMTSFLTTAVCRESTHTSSRRTTNSSSIDGYIENGQLVRSVNRIFVNGSPQFEHILETNDRITIGETELQFRKITPFNKQSIDQYIADQPTNLASHHIDLSEFGIDSPSTLNGKTRSTLVSTGA